MVLIVIGEQGLAAGAETIKKFLLRVIIEIVGGVVARGERDGLEELVVGGGEDEELVVVGTVNKKNLIIARERMGEGEASGER